MPIQRHPGLGAIVVCDFDQGFKVPEMVKKRLCVVVSPDISARPGLCTVVPLSTTPPRFPMEYHCRLTITPALPDRWNSDGHWVKGDMVCSVGFHRLDLLRIGKDASGRRLYRMNTLPAKDLRRIHACIMCSLGLGGLKKYLG